MKIYSILFFLLLHLYGCAQSQFALDYYHRINNAELLLADSNYSLALKSYDSAFNSTKNPFVKDYYNAALCALYANLQDKSINYLKQLFKYGITFNKLDSDTILSSLRKLPEWNKLRSDYNVNIAEYGKNQNQQYSKDIKRIYDEDQYWAQLKDSDPTQRSKFYDITRKHIIELKNLIKKFGFPDQATVGSNTIRRSPLIHIVIMHFYQMQTFHEKVVNIDTLLLEAVNQCKFHPLDYVSANQQDYGFILYIKAGDRMLQYTPDSIKIKMYDNKRIKIGLLPFESYKKVLIFFKKNPQFANKCTYEYDYNFVSKEEEDKFVNECGGSGKYKLIK